MSNAEIVVVGAGVAGLSAALAVADAGQDVTLVTKADLVESNTYHAQGGIAAAVFADDDPETARGRHDGRGAWSVRAPCRGDTDPRGHRPCAAVRRRGRAFRS